MNKNNLGIIHLLPLLLVGVLIAAGTYFYFSKNSEKSFVAKQEIVEKKQEDNNSISDWKTYTNDEYNFELKYPSLYEFINHDWKRSPSSSRYIVLRKVLDAEAREYLDISVEVLPLEGVNDYAFHFVVSDREYLGYLRDPTKYTESMQFELNGATETTYFFTDENPGEMDARNTLVVVLEHGKIAVVVKAAPTQKPEEEFLEILSTFEFTN